MGAALTKAETLPKALMQCAEAMVRHLGAATASLWTLAENENFLELQGSAWARRPLFGPEARVPVGEFRIGAIARDRRPALLDLTAGEGRADDKDWALREGMIAFAGYPLVVEDRLVGVMGHVRDASPDGIGAARASRRSPTSSPWASTARARPRPCA